MVKDSLSTGAQYHESLADKWDSSYDRRGFRRRYEFIASKLVKVVRSGERWLDLGCGTGTLVQLLVAYGAAGEGLDGSPAMIAAARSCASMTRQEAFKFRQIETIERLDCKSESFDGVLCSSVLEYVEQPDAALDEIYRVLRPGGHVVLSVANSASVVRGMQYGLRHAAGVFGVSLFKYLSVSQSTYSRSSIHDQLLRRDFCSIELSNFDPWLPNWLTSVVAGSLVVVVAQKCDGLT